jgi:UDP-hydrolysing UDP-N-acetyl-D-glucosamine 2-epimerase
MRRIGIVTTGRSDYGLLRPVIAGIRELPGLTVALYVTGSHLAPGFGETWREIEKDETPVAAKVEGLVGSDSPQAIAKSMATITAGFAQVFADQQPDLLLVLGDRFETHAAAVAALPFGIPLAHIHGGELSAGAIDESLRHGLTKMSHLHFTACETYARRVIQLGEEPWRVLVSGAPGLDNLRGFEPLTPGAFTEQFGFWPQAGFLLVTHHPVTRELDRTADQIGELLAGLEAAGRPIVFTHPCADAAGQIILQAIQAHSAQHQDARLVTSLGTQGYFTLLTHAAAMVGNSSSGILEAASFRLPVVNIGLRQHGRLRPANVIDVSAQRQAITQAISRATSPAFRRSLADLENPFGDGHAAKRIVSRLAEVPLDDRLRVKNFHDLPGASWEVCQCE